MVTCSAHIALRLCSKHLLSEVQSDYKPGHSCNIIMPKMLEAYDEGSLTTLAIIDFCKAFDTVNHNLHLALAQLRSSLLEPTLTIGVSALKSAPPSLKLDALILVYPKALY